ncbi:MAG: hypothetical protein ACRC8W_09730 [Plesiomonas shigelloides]
MSYPKGYLSGGGRKQKSPCRHCECITEVNENNECAYCAQIKEDEHSRLAAKVAILIMIILWLVIYGGVEYLHDAVVMLVG